MERTRKPPLITILFLAVGGVLSGANSCAAIPEFGRDRRPWFARFLERTHGLPSDDTFARVLARLDPGAFEKGLLSWIQAVPPATENRLIAIDGKTRRGSSHRRDGKAALPLVSAWASENRLSLGQVVGGEKSNEIPAIPELLGLLDVSGAVVTLDAMGCPKEIATQIRQGEGDYVLAVPQNQPPWEERVTAAVADGLEQEAACLDEDQTGERGHGRQETRTSAILPGPGDGRSRGTGAGPGCCGRDVLGTGRCAGTIQRGGPLFHPEHTPLSRGVCRSGPRPLEDREQPPLAVGRELP